MQLSTFEREIADYFVATTSRNGYLASKLDSLGGTMDKSQNDIKASNIDQKCTNQEPAKLKQHKNNGLNTMNKMKSLLP